MGRLYYTKYVKVILFFCCFTNCLGQEILEVKVKQFVPQSAIPSETHIFTGDLNRDGIDDAVLRFKVINEPEEYEHFYILLVKNDGAIKLYSKDIFSFDNKNGMVFDTVTISNDCGFTVKYCGKENTIGSYRKITFKYHADALENHYWLLNSDEELFQHKVFAPAPQKPIVVTQSDMRGIGGEFFGNIKENFTM